MTTEERLTADYAGTGLTVGKDRMEYRREELRRNNILSADELKDRPHGRFVRAAGCVIARQRPGTAHGFIFISMEDETGIANVIVTPDLYERDRLVVTRSKFILADGPLQSQDGVIHVKATRLQALSTWHWRSGPMTSSNQRIGGIRKEVDYRKLGPRTSNCIESRAGDPHCTVASNSQRWAG
jgi:DNA polymerase III alpha subunit